MDLVSELGSNLENIVKQLKVLKKKRGKIMSDWVDRGKNVMDGYVYLFGSKDLGKLGSSKYIEFHPSLDYYRHTFFDYLNGRKSVKRINARISKFEEQYNNHLRLLRGLTAHRRTPELVENQNNYLVVA